MIRSSPKTRVRVIKSLQAMKGDVIIVAHFAIHAISRAAQLFRRCITGGLRSLCADVLC